MLREALYIEVSVAKSLLEQLALVYAGRPETLARALACVDDYLEVRRGALSALGRSARSAFALGSRSDPSQLSWRARWAMGGVFGTWVGARRATGERREGDGRAVSGLARGRGLPSLAREGGDGGGRSDALGPTRREDMHAYVLVVVEGRGLGGGVGGRARARGTLAGGGGCRVAEVRHALSTRANEMTPPLVTTAC